MIFKNYEVIYILKPNVTEEVNLTLVNYYTSFIKRHGGVNIIVEHKGRRHLSYNINDYYDGIYVQVNYSGNGHLLVLLEKSMCLNDNILRYLTIKKD